MAQKGNLLSVRQDIRVVDATIRDGGLCNNFRFSDEFIRDLYKANLKAGVDYMEFGYKASKEIFDEDDFGKWKFCNDNDIRDIVGDNDTRMKIAVMADVGRTDFETDIIPKPESPIDLIRIATYINTIPAAVEMIEYCAKQGYETTINIMAVSKARTEDLKTALEILGQTPVSCFYIVDSYGSLYPEEARRYPRPQQPAACVREYHRGDCVRRELPRRDRRRHGQRCGQLRVGAASRLPQESEVQDQPDHPLYSEPYESAQRAGRQVGL